MNMDGRKPLREIVYEQLKMRIMTGDITPGTRMMEVSLAERMGVSRTPVREAIRKLEKEGLVVIEPRRGAYASEISLSDMVDVMEVREELEGLAASLAAKRITEEEIEELKGITEGYKKAIEDGDTEKIIHYDELFHKTIISFSGNKTLIKLSEMVQELALRFRYLYYDDFSRYKNMPIQHTKVIEALETGDSEAARAAANDHVRMLKEFVVSEGEEAFKQGN